MSVKRELERLQQDLGRLQRKYHSRSDTTEMRTPVDGRSHEEYSPVFYSEDPSRRQFRDPMVAHLRQRLAHERAESASLRDELKERRFRQSRLSDIRVPMYNGSTDFDEYLSQFMGVCEYHGWTDGEAAVMLLAKLQGDALSVAAALDDQTLRSLVLNLRRNFSSEQEEVATLKLSSRGQKSEESFQSLSFDIQRLTKKAYSKTDDETRDRIARDAFLNAISDDAIREKLRDQNPKTLAEAVRESSRLAANRDLEKTRVKSTVRQTSTEPTEIEELRKQIEKLRQQKPNQKGDRNYQGRVADGQWRSRNPGSPPTCWRCYKLGHIARWCPFSDEQIAEMKAAGQIPAQKKRHPEN